MAAVLEKGTTILALKEELECCGESKINVRHRLRCGGVLRSGKGDGADILA